MTQTLVVQYRGTSYERRSNCMLSWFLFGQVREGSCYMGYYTEAASGLFKLFVEGKKVYGRPPDLMVDLSDREAKLFKMIAQTHYENKRKIWQQFNNDEISKRELIAYLERVLPVCLLSQKLNK